ncbi:hypothetical protein [Klebsiella phage phiKp_32]|nr:hypothetical protein [Klebsiella phage phiKp_32]
MSEEELSLGYISVKVIPTQEDILKDKVLDAGCLPLDEGAYHATLIFDIHQDGVIPNVPMIPEKIFEGKVIGIKELGERKGDIISAVVLELDSPELTEEHDRLIQCGYGHSYPDYIPHISLAYKVTEEQMEDLKRQCESLIGKTFYLSGESIDWID